MVIYQNRDCHLGEIGIVKFSVRDCNERQLGIVHFLSSMLPLFQKEEISLHLSPLAIRVVTSVRNVIGVYQSSH